MKPQVEPATAIAVLFAAVVAVPMGLVLTQVSGTIALGAGLLLAILVAATASNELALYLLLFSMLLGPQFLLGDLEGASLGRGLTLRLDDVILSIVGLTWLAKTALYKELGLAFRTPLNVPMAAYAIAAILATGLGVLTGTVRGGGGFFFVVKYIQYFVIYFMVVNNLRDRRQFQRFLVALLLTAAVVSVIGVLQIPSGVRVSAPFEGKGGEPNTLGGYLVLMLALVLGLLLASRSGRARLLLGLLALVVLVPLLFTLSRASYLALIPMALALLVWSERKAPIALALALALVAAPFVVPRSVADRVLYTFTEAPHGGQLQVAGFRLDGSTSERIQSWRIALLDDWPKRPVFGFGVTGYRFLDAQYPRVLAETGMAGFAAFLWLQAGLFAEALRVLRRTRDPLFKGVALGFLAGFVALVTHSIGANTFIIVRIMEPFWFLTGMVILIPQLETPEPAVASPRPGGRRAPFAEAGRA